MRRILPLTLLTLALVPAGAQAAEPLPLPEGSFSGVDLMGTVPEAEKAIAIAFMKYEDGRDVMFVSTYVGLFAYDITKDPTKPVALGKIASADMKQPGDASDNFFENEDMEVDQRRKLVFMTRDVTSHTGVQPGVYIIDAKDPSKLSIITFQRLPEGHTSSCIKQCDFLWTAGLLARREIFATDITNPAQPVPWPVPIDVGPFDQPAGTSHDVDVDSEGIAWVSGQGYIRGYWTEGSHKDPITGQELTATPTMPVLYGGGKVPAQGGDGSASDLGRFMHNTERPLAAEGGDGSLIYAAEEAIVDCGAGAGEFVISSLKGALDTDATGTLETVGTFGVLGKEGEGPGACSAHWFTMRDKLVAEGFYSQGTRILDVSDPKTPIQVAYFRPDDGTSWAGYFHGDYIYTADNARGVDILRLRRSAKPVTVVPAGAAAACSGGPTAVVNLTGNRFSKRAAVLRGTAAAGCGKAPTKVQVALAQAGGGKCRFLSAKGKLGRKGSCDKPVFLKARGTTNWSAKLRGKLRKGSYLAFTRALGAGVTGSTARARITAPKSGRLRVVREVAPPG